MPVSLELLSRPAPRPDLFEQLLVAVRLPAGPAAASTLVDATAGDQYKVPQAQWLAEPSPDQVTTILTAGSGAEIDPWPLAPHDAADLLVAATHAGVGFGPGLHVRATTAAQVWTVLDATVCALTGEDVRQAWERSGAGHGAQAHGPQHQRRAQIAGLPRAAREAVRDVITWIRVPEERLTDVEAELAAQQ